MTGDPVTVGLMMFEETTGFAEVKFTSDSDRLRRIEGSIEREFIEALEAEIRARISDPESRALFFSKVPDWTSNSLDVEEGTGVLTGDPRAEFARQVEDLLVAPSFGETSEAREASERERIRKQMKDTFQKHDLLRHFEPKFKVSDYVEGDPLRFDYAYRTETHFRIFQAAPVETGLDDAKGLAFSYPEFRAAFGKATGLETHLTAVVENYSGPASPNRNFAYRAFLGSGIESVTVAELAQRAQRAREELHL